MTAGPGNDPNRDARAGQAPNARVARTTTTADQFPPPPSSVVSLLSASPQSWTRFQGANGAGHGANGAKGNASAGPYWSTSGSNSVASSATLAPEPSTSRRRGEKADSFILPTNLPAASFRAMPLLNSDLKTTTVEVLGSHIRANSKGKEVLSFVIAVHVVGKESWQVRGPPTNAPIACF